ILLVAQLELTSLRNVVRMMVALGAEEGIEEKVKILVNRVGCESFDGDISLKKAEETIGKPVYFQLTEDYKSMAGARNAGVPLLTHAPRSKLQHGILQLAHSLCG